MRTHCNKGHKLTEENTYISPRGDIVCRICKRAHSRKWYRENKERHRKSQYRWRRANPDKAKRYNDKCKQKLQQENIAKYKELFGDYCKLCRRSFLWCVYDFHHLDPSRKEKAINLKLPWETIEDEIYKVVLLCANCHRQVHARMNSGKPWHGFKQSDSYTS